MSWSELEPSWGIWQPYMMTQNIPWVNMAGLHRVHFHLPHILATSLRGDHNQAGAYMVQLLRALHQVALDGGTWNTGSLLLPKTDPLYKNQCGGTEEELEAIVAYREAMQKLKGRPDHPGQPGKGKGKGKEEDQA